MGLANKFVMKVKNDFQSHFFHNLDFDQLTSSVAKNKWELLLNFL